MFQKIKESYLTPMRRKELVKRTRSTYTQKASDCSSQTHGDNVIDRVNIFGEAIDNTTERSCVEERHWAPHNLHKHFLMESIRCQKSTKGQSPGCKQRENGYSKESNQKQLC